MDKIINILPLTVKKLGINKEFTIHSVLAHWRSLVGEEIAVHTRPREIQRAILFVTVDNSAWCHHLSMMKQGIIDKINAFAREKIITDIRFQAGYFENCQNQNKDIHKNEVSVHNLNKVPLNEQEMCIIQETVENLEDKYLKRKVMRLMRKDWALKKVKAGSNWRKCDGCTALCPPGERYCTTCKIQYREKTIEDIIKLLKEVPWIKHYEVKQHIDCSEHDFVMAKSKLIAFIDGELQKGSLDRFTVMTYIMLTTGAKIEALNDAIIEKTMERFRRKKDVFTSRR